MMVTYFNGFTAFVLKGQIVMHIPNVANISSIQMAVQHNEQWSLSYSEC